MSKHLKIVPSLNTGAQKASQRKTYLSWKKKYMGVRQKSDGTRQKHIKAKRLEQNLAYESTTWLPSVCAHGHVYVSWGWNEGNKQDTRLKKQSEIRLWKCRKVTSKILIFSVTLLRNHWWVLGLDPTSSIML